MDVERLAAVLRLVANKQVNLKRLALMQETIDESSHLHSAASNSRWALHKMDPSPPTQPARAPNPSLLALPSPSAWWSWGRTLIKPACNCIMLDCWLCSRLYRKLLSLQKSSIFNFFVISLPGRGGSDGGSVLPAANATELDGKRRCTRRFGSRAGGIRRRWRRPLPAGANTNF